jgi:hypothetical protein
VPVKGISITQLKLHAIGARIDRRLNQLYRTRQRSIVIIANLRNNKHLALANQMSVDIEI